MNFVERNCPLCGSHDRENVLTLRDSPFEDNLQSDFSEAKSLQKYPLCLAQCAHCKHLYLRFLPLASPTYQSQKMDSLHSLPTSRAIGEFVESIWRFAGGRRGDLVIDVGVHDSQLLDFFGRHGASVRGASLHLSAPGSQQIHIIDPTTATTLSPDHLAGIPRIICMHNTLANVENPKALIDATAKLMGEKTILSVIVGYHPDIFRAGMFDWIYHEHKSYFTAHDFIDISRAAGLSILRASRVAYKGGSLHLLLAKDSNSPHSPSFENLVAWERWTNSGSFDVVDEMMMRVSTSRNFLSDFIQNEESLVGYGSSHSTTTLGLNFRLEEKLVCLVDDNPTRHGWYSPLAGLEILPPKVIGQMRIPVVILAWQHDFRIRQRLIELGYKGRAVSLLPYFSIEKIS